MFCYDTYSIARGQLEQEREAREGIASEKVEMEKEFSTLSKEAETLKQQLAEEGRKKSVRIAYPEVTEKYGDRYLSSFSSLLFLLRFSHPHLSTSPPFSISYFGCSNEIASLREALEQALLTADSHSKVGKGS